MRYVGEELAVVIAETVAAAKDGAERVEVEYEALPAVTGHMPRRSPTRRGLGRGGIECLRSTPTSATP